VVLPNVNNWAHAAGFVSGFILGFLFWSETPEVKQKPSALQPAAACCSPSAH
jgi:membrane associated rhomboid family serine protease